MPAGLEANLLWATGKERAFVVGGKGNSYMSQGIYSSKEDALEGLETWLRDLSLTRCGDGSAASNYTLFGASGTVVVSPRPVNLIGSRLYDGTAGVLSSILAVTNLIAGETIAVTSGIGTLASKNVGAEAIASMGNLTLSSSNYTTTGGTGTVTISTMPITVAAVANTKTCDDTMGAAATPAITAGSLMGTDTFSTLSETYATKNAATNLTLTPNAVINDGNGGNNYVLTTLTNANGGLAAGAECCEGSVYRYSAQQHGLFGHIIQLHCNGPARRRHMGLHRVIADRLDGVMSGNSAVNALNDLASCYCNVKRTLLMLNQSWSGLI